MKGDVLEIGPAYEDRLVRIELFGDEVEAIRYVDPTTGEILQNLDAVNIYPAKHFVTPEPSRFRDQRIRLELQERLDELNAEGKLLELSGWSSAPNTISRCSSRWATAMELRITPVT